MLTPSARRDWREGHWSCAAIQMTTAMAMTTQTKTRSRVLMRSVYHDPFLVNYPPDSPAAFSESMRGYLRRTSNPASTSLETE